MTNKYDWGIYNGLHGIPYDREEKERNTRNQVMYMLNRSLLMFEYHNLPDSLPAMELERLLQSNGFAGVTEVEGELYAFYGGLGGQQDVYGRPTTMVISNPALKYNATLEIGKDVVLMRNDTMMLGLIPTFSKYCSIMNENEITMTLASISQRVNNLISVADDNTADSAKKYLEKLEDGKLGYIFESKLFDSLQTNPMNSGGTANLTQLIEVQQYLKASMYNEIGLNANYNMKRERLNSSEVEMNSDNLYPLVDNMLEQRRIALEQVNEKFGTDISVEFNSSWDYRINQGEDIDKEFLDKADEEQSQDNGFDEIFEDSQDESEEQSQDESEKIETETESIDSEEVAEITEEETEENPESTDKQVDETEEPQQEDEIADKEEEPEEYNQRLDEAITDIAKDLKEFSDTAKQSETVDSEKQH